MNYRQQHDECYQMALKYNSEGNKKEAINYAKQAIHYAKLMYEISGLPYRKCQAEYLLEMVESK
jgi:hypothetical protein